jgi:hypothetical protein
MYIFQAPNALQDHPALALLLVVEAQNLRCQDIQRLAFQFVPQTYLLRHYLPSQTATNQHRNYRIHTLACHSSEQGQFIREPSTTARVAST